MLVKKAGSLLDESQTDSSASSSSAWNNFFSKLRTLLPFVWPKNAPSLQLRVLICFLLLGAGRVANVYVPVLYKMLGTITAINTRFLTTLYQFVIFAYSWQYDSCWRKCNFPMGSCSDLCRRQVSPRRRNGRRWFSEQSQKFPVDPHPAIYDSRNRGKNN